MDGLEKMIELKVDIIDKLQRNFKLSGRDVDLLNQELEKYAKASREEGLERAMRTIEQGEGWEESSDHYRKILGLPFINRNNFL